MHLGYSKKCTPRLLTHVLGHGTPKLSYPPELPWQGSNDKLPNFSSMYTGKLDFFSKSVTIIKLLYLRQIQHWQLQVGLRPCSYHPHCLELITLRGFLESRTSGYQCLTCKNSLTLSDRLTCSYFHQSLAIIAKYLWNRIAFLFLAHHMRKKPTLHQGWKSLTYTPCMHARTTYVL